VHIPVAKLETKLANSSSNYVNAATL